MPIVPTALVTGPLERVADMALALKVAGFEVVAAEPHVEQIPSGLGEVDCYVQLPFEPPPDGNDALVRAHAIVARTLLARFDAAAEVTPILAPKATVVLVADRADGTPAPDMRFVRLLIEAIIADHGGDASVTVIDGAHVTEEIIAATRARPPTSTFPTVDSDLDFADWRNEIICQNSPDS